MEEVYEFKFEDKILRSAINHKNNDKNEEVDAMTCRLRDLNYECCIRCRLLYRKVEPNQRADDPSSWKSFDKIKIAILPVMVQSVWCKLKNKTVEERVNDYTECPYDQGGYFIVKGSEKVVVAQERMAYNFVYTFKNKEANLPWVTEIRSVKKGIATLPAIFKIVVKIDSKGRPKIFCRIKTVTKDIPLAIVMRALGITSDFEILETVCYKVKGLSGAEFEDIKGILEILRYSIEENIILDQNACVMFIGTYL